MKTNEFESNIEVIGAGDNENLKHAVEFTAKNVKYAVLIIVIIVLIALMADIGNTAKGILLLIAIGASVFTGYSVMDMKKTQSAPPPPSNT